MATSLTNQNTWYTIANGSSTTVTLSGYSATWYPQIQARWTSLSGTTYSMQYRCNIVKTSGSLSSATSSNNAYKIAGSGASTSSGGSGETFSFSTGTTTIKTISGTYNAASSTSVSVSGGVKIANTGSTSLSGTGILPAVNIAPTVPTISAACSASDASSVTFGTTNLGVPTGTVYLYGDTASDPITQLTSKTTTGNTTFSHTDLFANTTYYYKATATNSSGSRSSSVVNITTYPGEVSSVFVSEISQNSAKVEVSCADSGSALTTTLQMSNDGETWVDTSFTDVQGTTKIINISNLLDNTEYTYHFRVSSSVGAGNEKSITFTTGQYPPLPSPIGEIVSSTGTNLVVRYVIPQLQSVYDSQEVYLDINDGSYTHLIRGVESGDTDEISFVETRGSSGVVSLTLGCVLTTHEEKSETLELPFQMTSVYGSVNGKAKAISKLYCSVNGKSKKIVKLYGSVNGKAKRIF